MLDLYYETLCPFSAKFIVEQLPRIFDNGLIDIVTLQLVPWGNAIIRPNKTFECQVLSRLCLFIFLLWLDNSALSSVMGWGLLSSPLICFLLSIGD